MNISRFLKSQTVDPSRRSFLKVSAGRALPMPLSSSMPSSASLLTTSSR